MGDPITKMIAARAATIAAIECIDDGVEFGVVAGSNLVHEVYPGHGRLATASGTTRKEAVAAAATLEPRGGTAIGSWLHKAKALFGPHTDAKCHAILLTDGKNEHESDKDFAKAIKACEGFFVCDCRGVGDGWSVRYNLFRNFLSPAGQAVAGPAVLPWNGSSNTVVEGNTLTCNLHGWQWNLENGRCLTARGHQLRSSRP